MVLGGLQKLTLLDYPSHVACTVFTRGCNFGCPFCHNASLVLPDHTPHYDNAAFFAFLQKRKGILDGVAVSGGEPLLQPDIEPFLETIKQMGFAVKLDTNGSFPDRLERILQNGLADYVAMDVKNAPSKYAQTAGAEKMLDRIAQSISLLLSGHVAYEFRTTAVKELHEPADFLAIGSMIKGAQRYFIQQFVDSGDLLCPGFTSPSQQEMEAYLACARQLVPTAQLRGL